MQAGESPFLSQPSVSLPVKWAQGQPSLYPAVVRAKRAECFSGTERAGARHRPEDRRKSSGGRQDSRVAVGRLLVALVVLHVECHLAGLAVEACFMPELGTEAQREDTRQTPGLQEGGPGCSEGALHPGDWNTESPRG